MHSIASRNTSNPTTGKDLDASANQQHSTSKQEAAKTRTTAMETLEPMVKLAAVKALQIRAALSAKRQLMRSGQSKRLAQKPNDAAEQKKHTKLR